MEIKLEGFAELQKQLASVMDAGSGAKQLLLAARVAMRPVLEAARQNAPRDTGVLADSIYIASARPSKGGSIVASAGLRVKKSAQFKQLTKGVKKRVFRKLAKRTKRSVNKTSAHWRWHFVELGTSKSRARPFLRPAMEANKDKVITALKLELKRRIDKAAKQKAKNPGGDVTP